MYWISFGFRSSVECNQQMAEIIIQAVSASMVFLYVLNVNSS